MEGTESNNSEDSMSARPSSPNMVEARPSADGFDSENGGSSQHEFAPAQVIDDALGSRDGNGAFIVERSKSAKRRTQGRKGSIANSNGSFRNRSIEAGSSGYGNSRRTINAYCCEETRVPTSQGQPKNGTHRTESEFSTKRADGWSSSPCSNNRSEAVQSCACGTSHASSRSKVGHRSFGRTVLGEPNVGSRSMERTGVGVATKTPIQAGNLETRKSTDLQGRPVPATRDQRVGGTTDRPSKPSHSKSSSLDLGSGTSSIYSGGPRSSPSGTTGLENGFSVAVAVKPMWTPRAVSTSGGPNGIPGKVLATGGRPLDSEHGKSDSYVMLKRDPSALGLLDPNLHHRSQ